MITRDIASGTQVDIHLKQTNPHAFFNYLSLFFTETWMFPSILIFYPALAKSILSYRTNAPEAYSYNAKIFETNGWRYSKFSYSLNFYSKKHLAIIYHTYFFYKRFAWESAYTGLDGNYQYQTYFQIRSSIGF